VRCFTKQGANKVLSHLASITVAPTSKSKAARTRPTSVPLTSRVTSQWNKVIVDASPVGATLNHTLIVLALVAHTECDWRLRDANDEEKHTPRGKATTTIPIRIGLSSIDPDASVCTTYIATASTNSSAVTYGGGCTMPP
jgi:hypothetical protein